MSVVKVASAISVCSGVWRLAVDGVGRQEVEV